MKFFGHSTALWLAFLIPIAVTAAASDFDTGDLPTLRGPRMGLAPASRTGIAAYAETTYVGFTPGHSGDNYWSIWSGTGAEGYGRPPARKGLWDFEPSYGDVHGDSLQGFWPYRFTMTGTGGLTIPDTQRPWRALDFGNNANYAGAYGPGAGGKRTFGVVGVWHVDPGNTGGGAGQGVGWTPLAGTGSAWMGLRRHGDVTAIEDASRGGTGNALNEDVMMFQGRNAVSTGGSDKRFPGYGFQMDQMLYRDIDLSGITDTSLTVSFQYRTAMSTGVSTTNSTRCGWFQHDPLKVITGGANPNFIASSGNPNPPADSLMVYVGAAAEDSVLLSDGKVHKIFDPARRWFGEVLRSNEGLYKEIMTVGGTTGGAVSTSISVGSSVLGPLKAAGGNRVRLVFRVKTNQAFDDEQSASSGYTSGGVGAALVDDVKIAKGAGGPTTIGAFDSPSEIDQRTSVSALDAWKSTGKPTQPYHHVHPVSDLVYSDVCGQPASPTRLCNLEGIVVTTGDHDRGDESGHQDAPVEMEPWDGIISPTIQLCGPFDGPGSRNRMGLTADQVVATDDYYIMYDIYWGYASFFTSGDGWIMAAQSYPAAVSATGAGEHKRWGEIRFPGTGPFFTADPECFTDFEAIRSFGMLKTTNPSGIPDSIRFVLRRSQECYRFAISDCVNSDVAMWDNLSLAIVDAGDPPPVTLYEYYQFQDAFPFNNDSTLVGTPAKFDTTTALIKTGYNLTGTSYTSNRYDVPADTSLVDAPGASVRVDMVFRILPGPGNYVDPTLGVNSQLKADPTGSAPIPAPAPGVTNFWSNYMWSNGAHGTPGGHPTAVSGPLAGQKVWSANVWNSARCDTAEVNQFIPGGFYPYLSPYPGTSTFMTAYHETELADPHRGALGIARNVCFTADTNVVFPIKAICGSGPLPPGVTYPPAWVSLAGSGWNGSTTTKEGTKIIPDGLLTPGSHVEYFFRREDNGGPGYTLGPDTNYVVPQAAENPYYYSNTLDGHRWLGFGVLPDRWKSTAYLHPVLGAHGDGEACMLVIDNAGPNGNATAWAGTADSIGATLPAKYGAHTGWHAAGDMDPNDPAGFVRRHIGQPGTTWDLYTVRGSDSYTVGSAGSIGSRLAYSDPTNTQIDGKRSRQGPSLAMLKAYYKTILLLTGNINYVVLGPQSRKSQNDVGILEGWLSSGSTSVRNRGLWVMGSGIVEDNDAGPPQNAFNTDYLGVSLRNASYPLFAGYPSLGIDLTPGPPVVPGGDRLGLLSSCLKDHDVLSLSATLASETEATSWYQPVGAGQPYIASALKQHAVAHPWIALTDGFDLNNLTAWKETSTAGRRIYLSDVLYNVFGSICALTTGIVTDAPAGLVRDADFLRVRGNPVTAGRAVIELGVAAMGQVDVRLYDVSGRLVRVLADRTFPAGEHTLVWDGRDDQGHKVAGGVYFARIRRDRAFEAANRIVVLR